MTKLNADYIINSIAQDAAHIFENCEPRDRLSYQVGMLQTKIRYLVYVINQHEDLISEIKQQLDAIK